MSGAGTNDFALTKVQGVGKTLARLASPCDAFVWAFQTHLCTTLANALEFHKGVCHTWPNFRSHANPICSQVQPVRACSASVRCRSCSVT